MTEEKKSLPENDNSFSKLSKVMNRYRDNIKIMKGNGKLIYRMQMVEYAMKHSISEAAKVYNITRKTVRKWIKRYEERGKDGLKNKRIIIKKNQ